MENDDVNKAGHLEKPSGRYRPQFSKSSCDSIFVVCEWGKGLTIHVDVANIDTCPINECCWSFYRVGI
jgi:hypothetical protein